MKPKAVVLLSGGLDSATTLYLAKRTGHRPYCLIFDYGQRHRKEIRSAQAIARRARCKYRIVKFELPWRGSALLDKKFSIPQGRSLTAMSRSIPGTYVPARNMIFLSFATSFAEAIGAKKIYIAANSVDFSGYPDCRKSFYNAFMKTIRKGTKRGASGNGISIETPLISKTKAEIVELGSELKVPYELTWSCYKGGRRPCLVCDSCLLRAKGFKEAGLKDPLLG